MSAQGMRYLKIDESLPDPYGQPLWVDRTDNATPFEHEQDAQRVKDRVRNASGVIQRADRYFYVAKVLAH
jgi:hypothetical protein